MAAAWPALHGWPSEAPSLATENRL